MRGFGALRLRRVQVAGNSMQPTFNPGDILLVRWLDRVQEQLPLGSVVVIERDEMPGVFAIKRIQESHSGLYWVEGDNPDPQLSSLMNDSRKWGYIPAHEVKAKLLFRVKRASGKKPQQ